MRFDVPARLAEGREAVGHSQIYVSACQRRGFSHPDLTGYPGQLADWYEGEDGLDLAVLDDDCAALWATVGAAEQALQVQRDQLDRLGSAWRGPGSEAASRFLRAHCDAATALTARLRGAAVAGDTLRDELWRLIDEKVAAAVAIDDRVGGQRAQWLATAAADSPEADDVIDRQIIPYVENDIAGDWLTAMRATRASVSAAFGNAAAAAEPESGAAFPIPGDLGPSPDSAEFVSRPYPAPVDTAVQPAPPRRGAAAADVLDTDETPEAASPGAGPADAGELPGSLGGADGLGMPGGLGAVGGLAGLLPRIVDTIGSLLGSGGDGLGDRGLVDPLGEDPFDNEPSDGELVDGELVDDEEPSPEADEAEPVAEQADDSGEPDESEAAPPAEEVVEDVPSEDPAAVPAEQPVDSGPPESGGKTPCEIAADELPQVGE